MRVRFHVLAKRETAGLLADHLDRPMTIHREIGAPSHATIPKPLTHLRPFSPICQLHYLDADWNR